MAGVLDETHVYNGPLGCTLSPTGVGLALWAPTAQSVTLLLFDAAQGGEPSEHPMQRESSGCWVVQVCHSFPPSLPSRPPHPPGALHMLYTIFIVDD